MSVKKDLVSGVFYTSLAKYSGIIVQLVVTAILARLLTPSDYGMVAIATVFISFFSLLSDIGIGPAIIQFKDLSQRDYNSIFTVTAYLGVAICIVFFLCSWPIAKYYDKESLKPICQWLSLTVLFYCINIVPQNIQYKNKRFRFTAIVTLLVQISTAIVAIVVAWLKFGVYALVAQQILSIALIFTIYYIREHPSFVLKVEWEPIRKIMSFSIFQFLFNLLNFFSRNLDKLLVGRYIGLASLGQYEKSYRTMMMPLQNITFVITPVMQPIFSEMQNDLHKMAENYRKLFALLCIIGFPLSVLLSFAGEEIVILLFGDQWGEAVLPFRILALSVGLQILNGTTGSIYQSANATKRLFISGCWCAFFMVSAFAFAIIVWHTIVAVSVAFIVAQLFNSTQAYLMLCNTLHYPISRLLFAMVYPFIVSMMVGVVLFVISPLISDTGLLLSLVIKSVLTLTVWYLCVNFFGPYKGEVRPFLLNLKNKAHIGKSEK